MTQPFWGGATGIGSLPGVDVREAVDVVAGELPWPHLPELPARGPGADLVGRTGAVLVELPLETSVDGWRLAARPGRDVRRARSLLAQDLDALEERLSGYAGPLKVQAAGPLTLAACVETRSGHRAAADAGARRDLAASLAEGLRLHLADVRRRVPGALVSLQLDEPSAPAVLEGSLPTPSGYGRVRAVEEPEASALLGAVVAASADLEAPVVVHCCAADAPVGLLAGLAVAGVSVDLSLPVAGGDDALAGWLDQGRILLAGAVPAASTPRSAAAVAADVRTLARRLGFGGAAGLSRIVVTPTCGLAGLGSVAARTVITTAREAARRLADDPDGDGSGA